ncbi:hypothetical protein D7X12_21225 [Corallococcus sicarius]|uniref:DUF6484 domain-containing protein n=1 Tax=Corallococcus sicarius TaxID=2316726 RepID=A0A3A8NJZ7_9BACT|nr:hypothetical protein D7X12_21225 [Corallococcus sicarius]
MSEPRVGWVVGADSQGNLQVDFPGNRLGSLSARSTLALAPEAAAEAVRQRQGAVLLFENGDPALPLVMGLIKAPSTTPLIDSILDDSLSRVPVEARVDGKRVVIEGREEVVLRCGKASLTLRRDGQVVLRGVNVRTEAEQVQKIKGGKVQIN